MYQADIHRHTFLPHQSGELSALLKDVEGHEVSFNKENVLSKAIHLLLNPIEGVREYARYECQGCRIGHPSHKHHGMLQRNGSTYDYKYNEPALECLNIYDVIEDFDEIDLQSMMGSILTRALVKL